MSEKNEYDAELALSPSIRKEETGATQPIQEDAVIGDITEKGPNYRNVGWLGTVALMMKTQVGLGVLSIPSVFDTLGLVPGVICLIAIATITSWSGYMVGIFKLRHGSVYSIDDVGHLLFGRIGHWICCAGSGMLSISIGLNALSTHGACTAVFVAVGAIIGWACGSIQTLGRITWLAWVGLAGIITSILALTVAVGVQDRPDAAPQESHWQSDYKIFGDPTFAEAAAALASLVFAYAGTPAFFSIASEMRDPRHYTRSLVICQSCVTAIYVAIGTVVYYYCGSYVASPALGSAGVVMKKACYGLALPGLVVTTTLMTHYPAKYAFVRVLRGSRHLASGSTVHWVAWLGCTGAVALVAYVVASAVPVFYGLVALVGALLGTMMSIQPMGCMWLYDNWGAGRVARSPRWIAMVCWCVFVIAAGTFLMVAGTYGAIMGIMADYEAQGGSAAWSCADNSNST
ncbi:hypothetical protein SLS58_005485 [Diplodia intermedia]|uniref:Amino acid transporter transmembrane domain-containing protein n=1 Tax=Diplodia intermedia TaxID=856260 RepID=A0ABR3TRM0_9PEZI